MSQHHLVVGAGPVGRHVAALLVGRGDRVTVASRSGRDTRIGGAAHVALDASDADALTRAAEGTAVLYNCANPGDYAQWATAWPPLAAALLTAAERTGAASGRPSCIAPSTGPYGYRLPVIADTAPVRSAAVSSAAASGGQAVAHCA
jgi:nucleoside-diphosphate-sugar epimerase